MSESTPSQLTQAVLNQARALGADIAGVAAGSQLLAGPSYAVQPFMPTWDGTYAGRKMTAKSREVPPATPASVVVIGLAHPPEQPELDWWRAHIPSRTMGNVKLAEITKALASWLESEHGLPARDLAYYVEHGGVFLKDAASLAGLGVVGRNNLFLSRELGPWVRLRGVGVEAKLEPGRPLAWDPCEECPAPCREACPQGALDGYDPPWPEGAPAPLPGRDGGYRREVCNQQMKADLAAGQEITVPGRDRPSKQVFYCRRCELACPVGRSPGA
ncbi:MAG: hypothetical protein K9K66_00615 [Desulfarculaceae bacterium]|nr:hypothetical protein [Desulfarculaceae bacterium]MCF8072214.1 hypothetical protein [Desulfarculaceae bacterium]MCF8100135.1 hypothetical protein [Desulfarculaceae bacterium]MCF8117216.1 hypothetical protein [Desulfarculaceae bacterium]